MMMHVDIMPINAYLDKMARVLCGDNYYQEDECLVRRRFPYEEEDTSVISTHMRRKIQILCQEEECLVNRRFSSFGYCDGSACSDCWQHSLRSPGSVLLLLGCHWPKFRKVTDLVRV